MNEIRVIFSDEEAVSALRRLGATVELREVTRGHGKDEWSAEVWQVEQPDGTWADALPFFTALLQEGAKAAALDSVTRLDMVRMMIRG